MIERSSVPRRFRILSVVKTVLFALCALWMLQLGLEYGAVTVLGRGDSVCYEDRAQAAAGLPALLLSAVHVGLNGYGGQDEAFQVANVSGAPLVLTDALQVGEDSGRVVAFPASGITLEAGSRIWCARNAISFTAAFGFTPALEYGVDSTPYVPNLSLDRSFRLPDAGGWLYLLTMAELDAANADGGPWPAGDNDQPGSMERRDPLLPGDDGNWATSVSSTVGVDASGNAIVGTPGYTNSTQLVSGQQVSGRQVSGQLESAEGSPWVTEPALSEASTGVVINEIAWAGTPASHYDEWIELYNSTDLDVDLRGWLLVAADGTPAIQLSGTIAARGFYLLERTDDMTVRNIPADQIYTGALANSGETLYLYGADVIDALAYGQVPSLPLGWDGPPLEFYGGSRFAASGQILFRKQDETTGLPLPDTDTRADWANSVERGPPLYGLVAQGDFFGKRVLYPGWDWAPVLEHHPHSESPKITATAQVTVVVAPDNAYVALAELLRSAQQEILIGGYTFESVWLTQVLTERLAAGVSVTMLLEGAPAGGLDDAELWNCDRIVDAGGSVHFMHSDSVEHIHDRYRYYHSKYFIIDGRWVAVGSENWNNHAMPVDDKADGTAGDRGVFLITDQPQVVRYVHSMFQRDNDPVHHRDVVAYGQVPRYVVPLGYTPVYSTGGGGYMYWAPYSTTVPAFEADYFEVLHAPETALRYSDGLIELVLRAGKGDEVLVEQMHEPVHWGAAASDVWTDPNPRLEAYIQAARNGAAVRILLDKGLDDERINYDTAFYILDVARDEDLDLDVRMGDPTGRGIHNKMVLVRISGEQYVHVGSLNGSEVSSKVNRELALQIRSSGAYDFLKGVFEYDWAHSSGPFEVWMPFVCQECVPKADHVVISEVVYKLIGTNEEAEWVELYNPTSLAVDMSGWRLGDAVREDDYERRYAFPDGTVLLPGQIMVVAHQASAYQGIGYAGKPVPDFEWQNSNQVPDLIYTAWGDGDFVLGNTGDEVLLLNESGQPVDVLVYGAGVYRGTRSYGDLGGVYNGNSLERWPANRDTDDCQRDFRVRFVPDPGNQTSW